MEHSAIKDYYKFMIDAAILFGANETMAEQQLYNTLQFEMELAKVRVWSRIIFLQMSHFICFVLVKTQTILVFRLLHLKRNLLPLRPSSIQSAFISFKKCIRT